MISAITASSLMQREIQIVLLRDMPARHRSFQSSKRVSMTLVLKQKKLRSMEKDLCRKRMVYGNKIGRKNNVKSDKRAGGKVKS